MRFKLSLLATMFEAAVQTERAAWQRRLDLESPPTPVGGILAQQLVAEEISVLDFDFHTRFVMPHVSMRKHEVSGHIYHSLFTICQHLTGWGCYGLDCVRYFDNRSVAI